MNTSDRQSRQKDRKPISSSNDNHFNRDEKSSNSSTAMATFFSQQAAPNTIQPKQVLQLQRTIGNYATRQLLQRMDIAPRRTSVIQRDSPNEMVEEATGADAHVSEIGGEMTLSAGQTFSEEDGVRVHTSADTRVNVSITSRGVSISFSPGITASGHGGPFNLIPGSIHLDRIFYNFEEASWEVMTHGRRYVYLGVDVEAEVRAAMTEGLSLLPAEMLRPNYNPFEDSNIEQHLATIISNLSAGGSGGSADLQTENLRLRGSVVLDEAIRREESGLIFSIPSGTVITVEANLGDEVPEDMSDLQIESIDLDLRHPSNSSHTTLDVSIMDTDLSLIYLDGGTFSGGNITLDYFLMTEGLEAFGRLLVMLMAREEGRLIDPRLEDARQPRVRAFVQSMVDTHLEPMVQEMVTANENVIPGVNLSDVLGY